MAQPVAVTRLRQIPRVGNDVPKEIRGVLTAIRENLIALGGDGELAAIRRAEFMKLLTAGVRTPGVIPPQSPPGGGASDPQIDAIVEQYITEIRKLIAQAQQDIQGIFRYIEVNEALARDIAGMADLTLGDVIEHAEELAEHADELADHASELLDLATSIDVIETDLYDPVTGLAATSTLLDATVSRVDANEDSIDVLTASVTSLQSELIDTTALDPGIMWQFENDDEGWTSNVTLTDNSFFERVAAGASAYFRSPSGIAIDGRLFTRIVARIRRNSGTGWLGRASYAVLSGHGIDTTNYHLTLATEPSLAGGGWAIVTWDMEILTAGGSDWVSNTIDQIQLELSDDGSTVFDVDWVAIGRIAPSYVTSTVNALESRVTATENSITALSADITSLETSVTDLEGDVDANATAIDTLDTRITVAEGDISANSTAITSLDLRLDDAESDITANVSAISGLDTRLDTAEGTISLHSSDLTSLDTRLDAAEGDIDGNASAITSLDARVDATETTITTHSSQITALTTEVEHPTTGLSALNTLVSSFDSRITAAEDSVDSFSFTLTALENEVEDLDTEVGGFSTAISTLNTRVSTVEGNVSTQASQITLLQVRGGGVDANRVNPLDVVGYASGWGGGIVNADVVNINVGGRNAAAARARTSANLHIDCTPFIVEPNEILEVRFSILKRQARGMMYVGMNAYDDVLNEVPVTQILGRQAYSGPSTNPYWWYAGVPDAANAIPVDVWYDLTFYILGCDVPADQCPSSVMNHVLRSTGNGLQINTSFPWVSYMIDGQKLPAGCRRARLRFLNYYNNGVQTDMYVNHVSAKRIDNQNTAAVEAEQTARVVGDQANASAITTVSTTVNGHTTSINSLTTSVNGISAQWLLQLDSGGRISGIRLAGSPTFSSLAFLVDQFSIGFPGWPTVVPFTFGLVNGVPTLGITGNVVIDGTIITRHLIASAVTSPKIADRAVSRIAQGANFSLPINIGTQYFSTTFMDVQDGAIGSPPAIPMKVDWSVAISHSVNQDPANAFQVWLEYLPPGSGTWAILEGPWLPNSRNFLGEVFPGYQRMSLLSASARGQYGFRIGVQQFSGSGYTLVSALIQARADMK